MIAGSMHACVLSCFSCVCLFAILWIVAHQTPLSIGLVQARVLEWVAIPSSRGSSCPRNWTHVSYVSYTGRFFTTSITWEALQAAELVLVTSHVRPFVTPWTISHQAPLSMEFSRQEYYSLFQGIFLTQGSNWGLLHCRWMLSCLSHQGSKMVLKRCPCPKPQNLGIYCVIRQQRNKVRWSLNS